MRNTETGEFELVLGNRQVLSGFFIVVVLFGVFFTMGYIVGRNSAPPRSAQETASAANTQADVKPQAASGQPPQSTPATSPASESAPAASQQATPAESTAAAQQAPSETQPAESQAAAPAEAPADAGAQAGAAPPPGRYLQVSAVRREVAEVVLKTLKEKNFPALLAPGPNDRVRVLVGPYTDAAALGRAKAELENAGFQPFVQKY